MFGYVRPVLARLSPEQQDAYQGAYCGLCHALGRRHGWLARLTLQYADGGGGRGPVRVQTLPSPPPSEAQGVRVGGADGCRRRPEHHFDLAQAVR